MSSRIARFALSGYRIAGIAAYPFARPYLSYRAAKGKEDKRRRFERFGYASAERPRGPLVWFHAASVGETLALIPLIREIRKRDIFVLLTTGTVTSAELTRTRLGDDVIHQYVPLDIKIAVNRFLTYWAPDAAITAESEIWPVTMMELERRHIPQIRVNARLSDRSFDRWKSRHDIAESLFSKLALVVAQSDLDAERFRDLGSWPVVISGNLKGDTDPPPCDEALLETYRKQVGNRKTWAAISTFDGEEKAAATVHAAIKSRNGQLTIIVPRHPERGDDVEAMLKGMGLTVARRSRNDVNRYFPRRFHRRNGALPAADRTCLRRPFADGGRRAEPAGAGHAGLRRIIGRACAEFSRGLSEADPRRRRSHHPRCGDAGQGGALSAGQRQ